MQDDNDEYLDYNQDLTGHQPSTTPIKRGKNSNSKKSQESRDSCSKKKKKRLQKLSDKRNPEQSICQDLKDHSANESLQSLPRKGKMLVRRDLECSKSKMKVFNISKRSKTVNDYIIETEEALQANEDGGEKLLVGAKRPRKI